MNDKDKKFCLFKETFVWIDINIDITCQIAFLTFSNIKVKFGNQELRWRLYTKTNALCITKQGKLVGKKVLVAIAFDLKY